MHVADYLVALTEAAEARLQGLPEIERAPGQPLVPERVEHRNADHGRHRMERVRG